MIALMPSWGILVPRNYVEVRAEGFISSAHRKVVLVANIAASIKLLGSCHLLVARLERRNSG